MKTTAAHFEIFKREALRAAARLGLTDWELRFTHEDLCPGQNWIASVSYNVGNRIATVRLARTWEHDVPSVGLLRNCARHEIVHVLLADVTEAGCARASREVIEQLEHAVVRRLEKLL